MRHEHFNQSVTVSDNNVAVRFAGADDALMFMGTDHTSVTTVGTGSQQVSLFNTVDTVVTNHTAGNFLLWLGYGDTGVTVKDFLHDGAVSKIVLYDRGPAIVAADQQGDGAILTAFGTEVHFVGVGPQDVLANVLTVHT
jgi:hypothetical protein